MSFADELRESNPNPVDTEWIEPNMAYWRDRLTRAIKQGCREATAEGRRDIFGYVFMSNENGEARDRFVESLPLLRDQKRDVVIDPKHDSVSGPEEGVMSFEERLYEGFLIPGNVAFLQKMEQVMGDELQKLGFSDYRVQKVMLMDVYVIHNRKASLVSGRITDRITTRTAPGQVYTMHFSISW